MNGYAALMEWYWQSKP